MTFCEVDYSLTLWKADKLLSLMSKYCHDVYMMSDVMKNLGQNLVYLRKNRGLTQGQLAQGSGIPRTTLSYLESGQSNPSLTLLMKIAAILGVTVEELLSSSRPSCVLTKAHELTSEVRARGEALKIKLLPDSVSGHQFEQLNLKPRGIMIGTPHSKGTKEYFTCVHGTIGIFVEGEEFILQCGDVLAFPGDSKHSYHNLELAESRGISIVILQI